MVKEDLRRKSHNVLGRSPSPPKAPRKELCKMEECQPWTKKEDLPGRGYKTSYKLGHPRLHPFFTEVQKARLEVAEEARQDRPPPDTYRTSYKSAYTKKCDCYGVSDKVSSPHSLRYHMLFSWAEKLRSAPVRKTHETLSLAKDSYRLHLADETAGCGGLLSDLRPHTICNARAVSKDAQSKTNADEQCVQKILDPYITVQQYDYISYPPNERAKYRHARAEPVELIARKKTPVFDESFLRLKFMDRFLRKKPPTVPHSGLTTEFRDNYRLPIGELAHKKHLYCSSLVRCRQTKGEVLSVPAMYHTEYSHYGHDWPLSSII